MKEADMTNPYDPMAQPQGHRMYEAHKDSPVYTEAFVSAYPPLPTLGEYISEVINTVDPWDVPRPAETLDEALNRLENNAAYGKTRCRHCGASLMLSPLSDNATVWKHTNGLYTCDLPEKYGALGKDSIQFADPEKS